MPGSCYRGLRRPMSQLLAASQSSGAQRAPTRSQLNTGLPMLLFTVLWVRHIHCWKAGPLLTSGGSDLRAARTRRPADGHAGVMWPEGCRPTDGAWRVRVHAGHAGCALHVCVGQGRRARAEAGQPRHTRDGQVGGGWSAVVEGSHGTRDGGQVDGAWSAAVEGSACCGPAQGAAQARRRRTQAGRRPHFRICWKWWAQSPQG